MVDKIRLVWLTRPVWLDWQDQLGLVDKISFDWFDQFGLVNKIGLVRLTRSVRLVGKIGVVQDARSV